MIAAAVLHKRLAARHGGWNAALIAAGAYLVAVIVVARILPGINEVPDAFPAVVLWQFRIASFGMQLIMWTTIGLVFGALSERSR
jgi:predicted cobalt transporter CbtA